jgi:hypothetical protein
MQEQLSVATSARFIEPSLSRDKRLVSYVDAHGRLPDGPGLKTDANVQLEVRRTFGCVIRAAAKIIETPFDAPSG